MLQTPNVEQITNKFNDACASLAHAVQAGEHRQVSKNQDLLINAARDAGTAVEWLMKHYLFVIRAEYLRQGGYDFNNAGRLNFHELLNMMQNEDYAEPVLDNQTRIVLERFKPAHNVAGHWGAVPNYSTLRQATQSIRAMIGTYLGVDSSHLGNVPTEVDPGADQLRTLSEQRDQYFGMLRRRLEYLDIGGISEQASDSIVKVRLQDVYIPVAVVERERFSDVSASTGQVLSNFGYTPLVHNNDHHQRQSVPIRAEELLSKPRVVVLGDPGSGKTILGRFLAHYLVSRFGNQVDSAQSGLLPIMVEAREFGGALQAQPILSLFEYITEHLLSKYKALIIDAMERGSCLVIIDGLDEIQESLRPRAVTKIEDFIAEFDVNHFFVSSRLSEYRRTPLTGDFMHVSPQELTAEQIETFLEKWFLALNSDISWTEADEYESAATRIWTVIATNPELTQLAANPLMITLMAVVGGSGARLNTRPIDLLQMATETLLGGWPLQQRGLALNPDALLDVLEPIAHYIFTRSSDGLITEHQLREVVIQESDHSRAPNRESFARDVNQLLDMVEHNTGFFLSRGRNASGQKVYGFLHNSFVEYLTARYLARLWEQDRLPLTEQIHDPYLNNVLRLAASHLGTRDQGLVTSLVARILELSSSYEQHLHRDLILAAELLSEEIGVQPGLTRYILTSLVNIALTTPHMALWEQSVTTLWSNSKFLPTDFAAEQLSFTDDDSVGTQVRKAVMRLILGDHTDEVFRLILMGWTASVDTYELIDPFQVMLNVLLGPEPGPGEEVLVFAVQLAVGGHVFRRVTSESAERISNLQLDLLDLDTILEEPSAIESIFPFALINPTDALDPRKFPKLFEVADNNWLTKHIMSEVLRIDGFSVSILEIFLNAAIESVAPRERFEHLDNFGFLCGRLLEEGFMPNADDLTRWTSKVEELAKAGEDLQVRTTALLILSPRYLNAATWVEQVSQALDDKDVSIRAYAASLIKEDETSTIPSISSLLRDILYTDTSIEVREAVAWSMLEGGRYDASDIPLLIEAAFSDTCLENHTLGTLFRHVLIIASQITDEAVLKRTSEILQMLLYRSDPSSTVSVFSSLFTESVSCRVSVNRLLIEVIESILGRDTEHAVKDSARLIWLYVRPESDSLQQVTDLIMGDAPILAVAAIKSLNIEELTTTMIVDTLLTVLEGEVDAVAKAAALALSEVSDTERVQYISAQAGALLDSKPDNKAALKVLWESLAWQRRALSGVPI